MISLDRPGFGNSDFGAAISVTEQSVSIGLLLDSIQNNQPLYLVGHSLGGPLAVKLAAHYPKLVSGAVLLAASVDPEEEAKERWRPIMKAVPFRYLLPGAFRPSNIELWAFKKDVLTMPADLDAITCPIVIIQGMKDDLVPPGNAFYAQKKLVHAASVKMIMIDSANHFIPWMNYSTIKQALLQLMK
jgi:pimeloyl-ACP methyl ester carboxylesterase